MGGRPEILVGAIQIPSACERASDPDVHGLSERRPVALNPIRANMVDTPEESDYTSSKQRIIAAGKGKIPGKLCRFQGAEKHDQAPGIPCSEKDYIELVDATRRILRNDKRGAIDASLAPSSSAWR